MSLGQTGIDEDIYEAALKGDYIVLGWGGDENWSDHKYKDSAAVLARWTELGKEVTGNSGDVIQVARFRSMEVGDIVIVPEGNTRFRAIGEIDGDYDFAPGTVGGNHRRKVNWLVKLDESLPLETIYIGKFAQAACYLLSADNVKLPALKEMIRPTLNPGTAATAPYVLIIDEINRANISKVLGELITLLEPDKRLGLANEITLTLLYSKARFGVPKNLYIIGTMNTADRSITPIDTALRRRFEFVPMMPDYTVLAGMEVGGIQLDVLLKRDQ
jgi:5-methylcytosine-specific restriction protein B